MNWGGITSPWSLTTPTQFTDSDGDTLTYTVEAEYPGILRPGIVQTETNEPALQIRQWNPAVKDSRVTYHALDGYGGSTPKVIWIRINTEEVREIRENSPAGTNVGRQMGGNPWPYDGNADFGYTLTGEAATSGMFAIDSATAR